MLGGEPDQRLKTVLKAETDWYGEIAFTDDLMIKNAGQYAFYVTNLKTLVEVDDNTTPPSQFEKLGDQTRELP